MIVSHSPAWVPPYVSIAGRLFLVLVGWLRHGLLHLITPDGNMQIDDAGSPLVADLHIIDWRAYGRILRNGDVGFAGAYRDGWIDSGNLTSLLRLAIVNVAMLDQAVFGNALARFVLRLRHLLRRNSRRGSRHNIHLYYDLGNDSYRLWLDEGMACSSTCFNGNLRHGLAKT